MGFSFKDENDDRDEMDRRLREGLESIPVRPVRSEDFDWKVLDSVRPRAPWYTGWFSPSPAALLTFAGVVALALLTAFIVTHLWATINIANLPYGTGDNKNNVNTQWLVNATSSTPPPASKHGQGTATAGFLH